MVGQGLSGPLTYLAMQRGEWFAECLGLGLMTLCLVGTLLSPETRPPRSEAQSTDRSHVCDAIEQPAKMSSHVTALFNRCRESLFSIWNVLSNKPRLILLITAWFFSASSMYVPVIDQQYVTKRFGWSWAQVSRREHNRKGQSADRCDARPVSYSRLMLL